MKNLLINLWIFFFFFLNVSLSNDFAYITNQLSNSVSVIDLETYKVIKEISVGSKPAGVAVQKNGEKIFISNPESKEISVIDGLNLKNISNISLGKGPLGIALTKDDKYLLVADWYDNSVRVIDTKELNKIKTDSGLEEYAREKLFMKKEDEEIFIIEFDSIND